MMSDAELIALPQNPRIAQSQVRPRAGRSSTGQWRWAHWHTVAELSTN